MDFDTVMQVLGGPSAVARFLDIKDPSVHGWRSLGIPEYRMEQLAPEIERLSHGKYMRWDICPDVWHLRWPELLQRPDAPKAREVA